MLTGFEIIPINFVWVEPDDLINKFKALFEEKGEAARWIVEKGPLDLKRAYLSAPPRGGAHLTRFAVYYRRRIIAERLTPQIVMEYLKSLGWDLESDIFWKSEHESWFAALLNHG